ncbi:MAG: PQQ-like beta-propeller repeat protein [Alphaproteobacteria bacterium]|nr:PQQ-like beta-propeller repeat protein [Alphaproteobacteria bacterium]
MIIRIRLIFIYTIIGLLINNCSSIKDLNFLNLGGSSEEKILEGKRIDISTSSKEIKINTEILNIPVELEKVIKNSDWQQQGKNSLNSPENLFINQKINLLWKKDIGDGDGTYNKIYAQPVGNKSSIFVVDSEGKLVSLNIKDGSLNWEIDVLPKDESINTNIDGGLALDNESLIFSSSYGEIISINIIDGKTIWKTNIYKPVQGAPSISNNLVYQMTVNNELYAIDINSGNELWRYTGSHVSAISNGSSSPAIYNNLVIFPSNTGEIVALDSLTGSLLWTSSLVIEGAISGSLELTDIDSGPVINEGLIYSSSLSGKFAVIDLISGSFLWEVPIKTSNDPIVNGNSVFIASDDGRVISLLRSNGEVRWVANIYEAIKIQSDGSPMCSKPILAKDDIILACHDGNIFKIDSSSGEYINLFNLGASTFISPIIIDGQIIFYTEDAEVIVYR